MIASDTNLFLLTTWALAWGMAGETMLRPFGLAPGEIAAIASAGPEPWRHWSTVPTALATPREALLPALAHEVPGRVLRHVAEGRGSWQAPGPACLTQPLNTHLLHAWRRAAGTRDAGRVFGLDADDIAVLTRAEEAELRRWAELPVAVAIPRPGLLAALLRHDVDRLFVEFVRAAGSGGGRG
jgi:hypothetical protein